MTVWALINVFVAPEPTNKTELLPMVILQYLYNIIVMILSYVCMKLENPNWQITVKFVAPLIVYLFNYFRDGFNEETVYGFVSMINYDMIFMSAGMVDNFYWKFQKDFLYKYLLNNSFGPLTQCFMGLIIAITIPAVDVNEG